jgi:hypothetical protein
MPTAAEVLAKVQEDHEWTLDPLYIQTTDGIMRTLRFHQAALKALAELIDGHSNADKVASVTPIHKKAEPEPHNKKHR